jgi:aspartokinase
MKIMKFGGTSVGKPERMHEVAMLITKVSSGFRCLIDVDLPVPESAMINTLCAIFIYLLRILFNVN